MPSKTPAQRKLMSIAAHTKGGYGGVPQSVGKDFHQADAGKSYGAGGKTTHGKAAAREMAAMEQEAKLPPRKTIRRLPPA